MKEYEFENKFPLWHTHDGYVLKVGQMFIKDEIVQTWPDNDGGYWYINKQGRTVQVNE